MLTLRLLTGERDEMDALQRVLAGAPRYFEAVTGGPPGDAEAQSTFTALPPGRSYDDKFVWGLYRDGEMVGCADVVRGYPDQPRAIIGLLLLEERWQRQGLGRAFARLLEQAIAAWPEIERVRLGVVSTNPGALEFWRRLGYADTGEVKPAAPPFRGDTLVLEKPLLRIERLTPAQRDDYLRFFADHSEWAQCSCHFHHVSTRLDWSALDAAANRVAMDARIASGEMEGYLARRGKAIVGWLNAQPRNRLRHCDARIGVPAPPCDAPDHEAAAIVCFVIPADAGRDDIAHALLDAALDDLAVRGIRIVDAYPGAHDAPEAPARDRWRGPRSLFLSAGFVDLAHHQGVRVMRRTLREAGA